MAQIKDTTSHNQQSVQSSMQDKKSQSMCTSNESDSKQSAQSLFDDDINDVVRTDTSRRTFILGGLGLIAVALVGGGIYLHQSTKSAQAAEKGTKDNPVIIGTVGSNDPQWKVFLKKCEEAGVAVELKNFSDYTSANPALAQGSLDLNLFQHTLYLANYNVKNNQDLQPIAGDAVVPLGLYSKAYKKPADIPAGSQITLPNDETNQARALGVLSACSLIKLKGEWNALVTPKDVDEAASKVRVVPVEAAKVATSLQDPSVAAAVINNTFTKDAGLNPQDAIFADSADSPSSRPYINVWVARKEDENNPVFKKVTEIWHDKEVSDAVIEHMQGQVIVNNDPADLLKQDLADLEQRIKEAQTK